MNVYRRSSGLHVALDPAPSDPGATGLDGLMDALAEALAAVGGLDALAFPNLPESDVDSLSLMFGLGQEGTIP